MVCPFCGNEMVSGTIMGDARQKVVWNEAGTKRTIGDALTGKGILENVSYSLCRFGIKADYCPRCEKMVFDTAIRK